MWKRRAWLGGAVAVVGVILALSTFGATALGGRCTREICFIPGAEGMLVAGVVLAVFGGIVMAWAVRGMRRNDPTRK
jgi:protein-S-isoprenylcysteine O-methyltransferase Ste14